MCQSFSLFCLFFVCLRGVTFLALFESNTRKVSQNFRGAVGNFRHYFFFCFVNFTVDSHTLQRERHLSPCGRCMATLCDLLIFASFGVGIVCELIGALDLNHNTLVTLDLFYFAMFFNHGVWSAIWILFYFLPNTFLSNQFRLLKIYSVVLIIVAIFLNLGYVDMIEHDETLAEKWYKTPDVGTNSYRLEISGMIVGLVGIAMITFIANFWLPHCFGASIIPKVSLSMKTINFGLVIFVGIYIYACEVFFGWFGLYGTDFSFVLAVLVIECNVWQENIVRGLENCVGKYCGRCAQLWVCLMK